MFELSDYPEFGHEPDGVFAATQKRSMRMRNAYLDAGIDMLNERRLGNITIPELSSQCGYSVGGFYSRFRDKESFFKALQLTVVAGHQAYANCRIGMPGIAARPVEAVLADFVDVMVDIFTGPGRGVLRESLLRIDDSSDPWRPMRESGRTILGGLQAGLADRIPGCARREANDRLSFLYQCVVGVLHNDLVNAHHVFSTREGNLRGPLKVLVQTQVRLRLPRSRPRRVSSKPVRKR